jgi:thioredoxin
MKETLPKSFKDLITQSDKPVLVDFYATWCGPCRMVSPAIERIAKELKGKILTVKIDIDKKQHIAAQYQVQAVPTIMMFHRGESIMRLQGALPYDTLKHEVETRLPG